MTAASTPCTRVCTIEPESKTCIGCGRTLAEIAVWSRMSEAERLAVMATLATRLARYAPPLDAKVPTA